MTTPPASAPSHRLPALDILRGIAILGTLLTNIGIFIGAVTVMGAVPELPERADLLHGLGNTFLELFTDGKFIGLLTIMFGIGLEIQRQSALKKGLAWPGHYPWRAGLLILDGLLNYLFIFEYDVLMGYGLTALVVAFVLAGSPKVQRRVMVGGLALHLAVLAFMSAPPAAFGERVSDDPREAAIVRLLERPIAELNPEQRRELSQRMLLPLPELARPENGGKTARQLLEQQHLEGGDTASYWGMVRSRAENFWGGRGEIPIMFTMGLGLFLVGAQLYRAGLFAPEGHRLRLRVMALAFGVGMPIDWVCRLYFSEAAGMFPRYFTSTLVSFGILALVAHLYAQGRRPGLLGQHLGLVGRMALSNYIGQNLLASLLFYRYGLGLADRLAGYDTLLVTFASWAGISLLLVLFSKVWLSRFARGPVEWVWHLSYEAIVRRLEARKGRRPLPEGQPLG